MSNPSRPGAVDFSALDFGRLWLGRDRTTAVERAVLGAALGFADRRRVLEVGAGEGRLTPVASRDSGEFVALDLTPSFLGRMTWEEAAGRRRVAANVHALPFSDASFTSVVMERMYNFLETPGRALAEIRRVLVPGGSLVLSYYPKPSLATLVDDFKVWSAGIDGPFESATFSPHDLVPVRPSTFRAWAPTRARFRRTLEAEQYSLLREFPTGLEDFRPFGVMPAKLFVRLASEFPKLGGFPNRLVLAQTPPGPSAPLRPWSEIWACPRCARPFRFPDRDGDSLGFCGTCLFPLRLKDGVLDARHPMPLT
jgi:ubiquinone/menaquinone biosynthesis C-methylase UbiE